MAEQKKPNSPEQGRRTDLKRLYPARRARTEAKDS